MERHYRNSDNWFNQFCKRETGLIAPRIYSRRLSASQTTIRRFELYGKLNGHQGCVNAIAFNSTGELLVSGSDDRQIMLWDWAAQKLKLSYESGHFGNIFQTKFMPFTDDSKIISSAADCQVRLSLFVENGSVETKRLAKHQGRVHSLAVEPGSPYVFYSCGEDGFVQHYDLRSYSVTKLFYCSSLAENSPSSSIGLNSIAIDPRNPNYFAVGGADVYAQIYDIRKYQVNASTREGSPSNSFCPHHLIGGKEDVSITALAYSNTSELLVSYSEEFIYLFQRNTGLGPGPNFVSSPSKDLHTLTETRVYSGHRNSRTVKGVNFFGPNDEYVVSGSDCGRVFIWSKKSSEVVGMMIGDRHIVNQLESHPVIPVLATCGIENNIKLWSPSSNDISPLPSNIEEIMEANMQSQEDYSRISFTPDVIMHVLRLHRRRGHMNMERHDGEGVESDEDDDRGDYLLGFSENDNGENGENPRECNIS